MLEHSVMEVLKWFMTFFFIVFMITIALFLMQVQDSNTIKQSVNYAIERNGGLTDGADGSAQYLETLSKTSYGDRFKVYGLVPVKDGVSLPANTRVERIDGKDYELRRSTGNVGFGNEVHYIIQVKYNISFFSIISKPYEIKGSSVSQVRS